MGAYPTGSETTVTSVDPAIPQYWDAVALEAAYSKATLAKPEMVMAEVGEGKKFGDIYNWTELSALTTNATGADGAVANQEWTHTNRPVSINQWREITVTITDRAKEQSVLDYGELFSKNAGKAAAEKWDTDCFGLHSSITGANQLGSTAAGLIEVMSDDLALEATILLDDLKVEFENRSWHFAPRAKAQLLKLDKFVYVQATGEKKGPQIGGASILGDLYGSPVSVSALVATSGSPAVRKNLYIHRQAMGIVTIRSLNVEKFARVSKADTYSADTIYGFGITRPTFGVVINTQA